MTKELEDRLTRLEETVYFQEQALRELNDALVRQQAQLDEAERLLEATRERLREAAKGRLDPETLERAILAMPPRYLVVESPETILAHLELLTLLDAAAAEERRMRPSPREGQGGHDVVALAHEALPGGEGFAVTVAARRVRALFATVAGVLALHDLSIHDADVFVLNDGATILALRTANPPDVLYADEVFARVQRAIRYALTGKLFLAYRLARKRASQLYTPTVSGPRTPPAIVLDNRASDLFTVIEVTCDDRVGLLYDIARTLYELRLETHLAKVMTPAGRVRDVFYVRGYDGRRVEDPEQVREIKAPGEGSGLGAIAGGLLGGVLGNQVGGGNGRKLATVAGAVGGAYAGHQIEKSTRSSTRYEVTVRLEDGSRQVLTLDEAPSWRAGDPVRVENGQLYGR